MATGLEFRFVWGYGLREKAEIGCALTPDGQFFKRTQIIAVQMIIGQVGE